MERLNPNIVFGMTLASVVIWSVINQNSDILIGTVIGSGLFQILVVNGVNKLSIQEESTEKITFQNLLKRIKTDYSGAVQEKQIKYRSGGQYLIVSVIVLLFLSADYLLKGKYVRNVLNQVDGGILIILFITYIYLMKGSEEIGFIQKFLNRIRKKSENATDKDTKENTQESDGISKDIPSGKGKEVKQFCSKICMYFLIGIVLLAGGFLLVKSVPNIAVSLGISQYGIGLTLMAWCVNILSILLSGLNARKYKSDHRSASHLNTAKNTSSDLNQKKNYYDVSEEMKFEKIMENTIFSITLLLGIAVLIRPVFVNTFMIYHLILFGIVALLVQLAEKIDNRLAGSSMAAVYIGFIIYNLNVL